jgi:HAD superfamily hydrolase (TIGR01549 family)
MRAVRAVLFDVGCTLIDPQDTHFIEATKRVCGRVLPAGAALRALAATVWEGAGSSDPVRFWASDAKAQAWAVHAGLSAYVGIPIWEELQRLDAASPLWSRVDPLAAGTLTEVRRSGYRTAAVSNGDGTLDEALRAAGLRDLFDVILDSHTCGLQKPDSRMFQRAAELLDVSLSASIFVGDDPFFDIMGSRAAGIAEAILVDKLDIRHSSFHGPFIRELSELSQFLVGL